MKLVRSLAVAAVLTLVATPAVAQDSLRFITGNPYGNPTGYGARVGPYWGQIFLAADAGQPSVKFAAKPGQPIIDIFCVDYLHFVTQWKWEVRLSALASGNLSNTYQMQNFGYSQADALARYQQAAWLATQMTPANKGDWPAIHGTLWKLMATQTNGTLHPGASAVAGSGVNPWQQVIDDANGAWTNIDLAKWTVLTDVRGVNQEYLVRNVVPEPGTLLLLGTGLLGLGLVFYRRLV